MPADNGSHSLEETARSERVVLFVSNLTDARPVIARLTALGVPYQTELMGMADPAMRERFQALQAWTGWTTLPQIFINGDFVGGIEEALAHPMLSPISPRSRRLARWLGYAGLLPFLGLVAVLLAGTGPKDALARLLSGYGAVILTFLGAVHWGRTLAGVPDRFSEAVRLLAGVLAALIAWLTLAADPAWALRAQAAAFAAMWAFDLADWQRRPEMAWYRRLRTHLSIGAIVCLVAGALILA